MSDSEDIDFFFRSLAKEDEWIARLASRWLNHLLEQRIDALVSADDLAKLLTLSLNAAAKNKDLHHSIALALNELRQEKSDLQGCLADRLPATLIPPLDQAARRDFTPAPDLVRAVLDHPPLRRILGKVLRSTSLEFGKRVWASVGQSSKKPSRAFGLAAKVADVAKGVASVVGGELEKQLENRATAFVEEGLSSALDMAIDELCSPRNTKDISEWRRDALFNLLAYPLDGLMDEIEKVSPETAIDDLAQIVTASAEGDWLKDLIYEISSHLLKNWGATTIKKHLSAFPEWEELERSLVQQQASQLQSFFSSDSFQEWVVECRSSDAFSSK